MSKTNRFQKLTRETLQKRKLRLLIDGPTGGGKTFTALKLATGLVGPEGRVAVLDTEESADLYHELRENGQGRFKFDQEVVFKPYDGDKLIESVAAAAAEGYDCLIIDSGTHFWERVVEVVDSMGIGYPQNWKKGGELWGNILNAIMGRKIHLIVTARAGHSFESTKDDRGKTVVKKLAMSTDLRKNTEFEFDVVLRMEDAGLTGTVTKSRISALNGRNWSKPGTEFVGILRQFCMQEDSKRATTIPMSAKEKEKFQSFQNPDDADAFADALADELVDGRDGRYLSEGNAERIIEAAKKGGKEMIAKLQAKLNEYGVTAVIRVPWREYDNLMFLVDPTYTKESLA
jgi:energy-coupling factor transporter ATP-binding protein EcfA2